MSRFDLAVVGAGIVGLAHALIAARRGSRVLVVDRDARANGASIRNFGFITVTGQSPATWARARRSRDIWNEIAPLAGIPIVHRNECVIVHSPQALAVLEEFRDSNMGENCEILTADLLAQRMPMANVESVAGALWSPHELRVEPRTAIPALATYLESELEVTIHRGVCVRDIATLAAGAVIVAPGPDLVTLFPEIHARNQTQLCKLQMLRLGAQPWRLPASVMSDFGLIRYGGFSAQPAASALRALLEREAPKTIEFGIHLIAVQSEDGSLVIGDSHDYAATPDPFYSREIEQSILDLVRANLNVQDWDVVERWIGVYPQSPLREWFVDAPDERTRIVQITTGNGMSTAFGLAEEVVSELFG